MSKCLRCNENEKAPGAYKYCEECREIADYEADRRSRIKNRPPVLTPCEECETIMTKTKYCYKCAPKVHRRENAARVKRNREEIRKLHQDNKNLCERCHHKEKWSDSGSAKYCYTCREIVKKETEENKRSKRKYERKVVKERKKPIHKGIVVDPDKQSPTIQEPLKVDDGINPYFLRRKS